AVAEGAAVQTLLEGIKTRERERDALQAKLEHLDGFQQASASWDAGAYGERVREVLSDWQRLLGASPEVARQVIGKLLTTPIHVFPVEAEDGSRYFRFGARGSYGRALGGIIGISAGVNSQLVTVREAGVVPPDDLAEELRQLIREQSARSPGISEWSLSVVPKGGLEPPRVAPHAPQTCASANSATSAPTRAQYAVAPRALSIQRPTRDWRRRGSRASRIPSPTRL